MFLSLTLVFGQFDSSIKQISNRITRPERVCYDKDLLIRESEFIPSHDNQPPFPRSHDSVPMQRTLPPRPTLFQILPPVPSAGSNESLGSEAVETPEESSSGTVSEHNDIEYEGQESSDERDVQSRSRSGGAIRYSEARTLNDTKSLPSLPQELDDQLLLYTAGTKLCMAGTNARHHVVRTLTSGSAGINRYFCMLEVLPK